MRHSHELRKFLTRQADSQDAPIDRGKLYLRVFRYAKVETVSDPYAFLHKTAIKRAKDHRRRRSAWFRRTVAKPPHR
jgi:hypothetical protein